MCHVFDKMWINKIWRVKLCFSCFFFSTPIDCLRTNQNNLFLSDHKFRSIKILERQTKTENRNICARLLTIVVQNSCDLLRSYLDHFPFKLMKDCKCYERKKATNSKEFRNFSNEITSITFETCTKWSLIRMRRETDK